MPSVRTRNAITVMSIATPITAASCGSMAQPAEVSSYEQLRQGWTTYTRQTTAPQAVTAAETMTSSVDVLGVMPAEYVLRRNPTEEPT